MKKKKEKNRSASPAPLPTRPLYSKIFPWIRISPCIVFDPGSLLVNAVKHDMFGIFPRLPFPRTSVTSWGCWFASLCPQPLWQRHRLKTRKIGIKQQIGVGEPGKVSDKTRWSQNGLHLYETLQIAAMDTSETSEIPSLAA